MSDDLTSARIISERELEENFEEIIAELRERNESALISRHGRLVARLVPVADDSPLLSDAFARLAQRLPSAAESARESSFPIEQLTAEDADPKR